MKQEPELVSSRMNDTLAFERASATPTARRRAPARTDGGAPSRASLRATLPSGIARMSLEAQQAWFQTVVMHPESVEAGAAAAGQPIARVVAPGAQISAAEGLGVYHYAYRARLVECLADDYPALRYALGEDAFEELAGRYVVAHPSRSPNLNAFGRHMEAFCRAQDHALAGFWADLAKLEWALVEILHAEDAPAFASEELARIPTEAWGRAKLAPSETLRLCRFAYPVNAFFQAFKADASPQIPERAPQALAVYRTGFTLWRMALTPTMADLLGDLARGLSLGDALGAMEARFGDPDALAAAARDVMAWFSAWVQAGFFRSVALGETPA